MTAQDQDDDTLRNAEAARAGEKLRRKAERGLKKSPVRTIRLQGDADIRRVVHELQVHEIELEMQKSELEMSRDQAELLLEKYTELYDFSPVGYFSLNANGRIVLVNISGASLVRSARARLAGLPFAQLLARDSKPVFHAFFARVLAGENPPPCEMMLEGSPPRIVSLSAQLSADRQGCQLALVDITARKGAEDELHRRETLFLTLVEQAPTGMYLVDDRLRLQQVNPKGQAVFANVHPLFDRHISEILRILWPQAIADETVQRFRHTLKTGETYYSPRFSERRADTGADEFYEWQLQRLLLLDGRYCVVCFFNDLTAQKRADAMQRRMEILAAANESANREIVQRRVVEACLKISEQNQRELLAESRGLHAQLRLLTRQIITTQEEERKQLSRELHDDLMQTLVGINVELSSLARDIAVRRPAVRDRIAATQEVVRDSVKAVHRFARDLRPSVLDDFGLIPALQDYVKNLARRKKLKIQLTAFAGVESLSPASQIALYRVTQEALTNIGKHAKAGKVTVNIRQAPNGVNLEIADNGRAFDVNLVGSGKSRHRLGLVGMRERVEMVGGNFSIVSVRGTGTTIRADFPLTPEAAPPDASQPPLPGFA